MGLFEPPLKINSQWEYIDKNAISNVIAFDMAFLCGIEYFGSRTLVCTIYGAYWHT